MMDVSIAEQVTHACESLRLNANVLFDQWNKLGKENSQKLLLEETIAYKRASDVLWRLKDARHVLRSLADSLDPDIVRLEDELIPASRIRGLASSPPEVIHAVFEDVARIVSDEELDRNALSLAQVSRQFRQIALSTPALWAFFGPRNSNDFIQYKLDLCKDIGFRAKLDLTYDSVIRHGNRNALDRFNASLNSLRSDKQRCLDLVMVLNAHWQTDLELGEITLPSLNSLSLWTHEKELKWRFPSLKRLSTNILAVPSGVTLSNITDVTFSTYQSSKSDARVDALGNARDLLNTLQSSPRLEQLTLRLGCNLFKQTNFEFFGNSSFIDDKRMIDLPQLHTLDLTIGGDETMIEQQAECLFWFTRRILAPDLRSVHLTLLCRSVMRPYEPQLTSLFPVPLLQARKFSLEVKHTVKIPTYQLDSDKKLSMTLDSVIRTSAACMPHIQELKLVLPQVATCLSTEECMIPGAFHEVHSMHLEGWHFPQGSDKIEALVKELARHRLPFLRDLTMVSLTDHLCSIDFDALVQIAETVLLERVVGAAHFIWKHRAEIPTKSKSDIVDYISDYESYDDPYPDFGVGDHYYDVDYDDYFPDE